MNSIVIKKLDKNDSDAINDVVNIHLETFKGFFLTFMGRGFLKQMYKCYVLHPGSGVFIAVHNSSIVGFLAYSQDVSNLYVYMLTHRLIQFAWFSLFAFLRKPKVFLRLIRAFLKPSETKRNEKYMEISSIGVSPLLKGHGIGGKLIDSMKQLVDFNTFDYISLETDAENNDSVRSFYEKNGFIIQREYQTREGRNMLEYRFTGERYARREENPLHT